PSHTYTQPGLYTVSLSATNTFGSDTRTRLDYIAIADAAGCVPAQITNFDPFAPGASALFRPPRFSPTSSAHLAISPNVAVVAEDSPTFDGTRAARVQWAFVDNAAHRWLRLTTSNVANVPNPTIDLRRPV